MAQMMEAMILGPWRSKKGGQTIVNLLARPDQEDLSFMTELIEAGKVTPVIDRCYPLTEGAEALRYQEAGHANGKVVMVMGHDPA
jgi:NADPH:quinone reductase-like Zn-dependent oxidoreductase